MLRPSYHVLFLVLLLTVPACQGASVLPIGANGGAANTGGSSGLGGISCLKRNER